MKPIFLLSLPRSGSTLLQRVLANHPDVATRTEPWILVPMLYMLRDEGVFADYGHRHSSRAINEFLGSIDNGSEKFKLCLRQFIYDLYGSTSEDGELFFLDKTPRYSLIAEQVLDVFPDDKFVVLWRNPLAVVASIIKTFRHNNFMFLGSSIDLFEGFTSLYKAYIKNKDNVCSINFEDLVRDSENQLIKLFSYLEIEYDSSIIENFNKVKLAGTYGDKTGYAEFNAISSRPLDSWKTVLNTPVRKRWCRNYLSWLGKERLKEIGYSYNELLDDLDSVPNQYVKSVPDTFYLSLDLLCKHIEPFVMKRKFKKMVSSEDRMYFLS